MVFKESVFLIVLMGLGFGVLCFEVGGGFVVWGWKGVKLGILRESVLMLVEVVVVYIIMEIVYNECDIY